MTRLTAFGLVALIPAAFGVATPVGATATMPICRGDGVNRVISIPLGKPSLPGGDPSMCCAKGCHGSNPRKRVPGKSAPLP